jgi:hypothetical protein
MAEEPLDLIDVDSLLEKVGGETVSQGMNAAAAGQAGFFLAL